jgi:hypothetical protein
MTSAVLFKESDLSLLAVANDVDEAITIIHRLLVSNKVVVVRKEDSAHGVDIARFHRYLRCKFRVEFRGRYLIVYEQTKRKTLLDRWF